MTTKDLTEEDNSIETPNVSIRTGKPLNNEDIPTARGDINVLKSKLQKTQDKEFKKNIYILSFLILGLGILGIYLTV